MLANAYKIFFAITALFVIAYFAVLPTSALATNYYNSGTNSGNYWTIYSNYYYGEIFKLETYAKLNQFQFHFYAPGAVNTTGTFVIATQNGLIQASTTINFYTTSTGIFLKTLTIPEKQYAPGFYFFGMKGNGSDNVAWAITGDGLNTPASISTWGNAGIRRWNGTDTFYCTDYLYDCSNQYEAWNGNVAVSDREGILSGEASFTSSTWAQSPLSAPYIFGSSTISFSTSTNCWSDLTFSDFLSSSTLNAFGCLFFVPTPSSLSYLNDSFSQFSDVFPFSLVFDTINKVRSETEGYSETGQSITVPLGSASFMNNLQFTLSSSSFSNAISSETKNTFFDLIKNGLWLLTGGIIIFKLIL